MHVETVCLLINQNAQAKHHVNVGIDAEDYYKIKEGKKEYFGRTIVEDITGLKSTRASELIKLLVDSEVIVPVTGHGKGKYRFQL